jgi:hypothetical protein
MGRSWVSRLGEVPRKTVTIIRGLLLVSASCQVLTSCAWLLYHAPDPPDQGLARCFVETFAGIAGQEGVADGSRNESRFSCPCGIATDGVSLFVADTGNHTIRRITIAAGEVTTLAGNPGIPGILNGIGSAARFNHPTGIATDGVNLYITDTDSSTIRMLVIASGDVTTIAGAAGVTGTTDGIGAAARFDHPSGIAIDGTGLYVTDTRNHTIRKIVLPTGEVTTIAGQAGFPGSGDGPGTSARFHLPSSIVAGAGTLAIADTANCSIRSSDIATTETLTLAGTPGQTGSSDGPVGIARFCNPGGIAADANGIYVADTSNGTIRSITWNDSLSDYTVETLAGVVGYYGSVDSTGDKARFYWPLGLAVSGSCLYVADSGNHTIRVVTGF